MAYEQGARDAISKYASGVGDAFREIAHQFHPHIPSLASQNLRRNLNVAGLGLIAAPTMHSLLSHDEDSPGVARAKHLSDLAGLGLLIGTEFMKH